MSELRTVSTYSALQGLMGSVEILALILPVRRIQPAFLEEKTRSGTVVPSQHSEESQYIQGALGGTILHFLSFKQGGCEVI